MECKIGRQLFYTIGSAILVLLVFKLSFDYMIRREFQPNLYTYKSIVHVDSLTQANASKQSINLKELVDRVDSINKVSSSISQRYQDDVNLMIYKTTQWLEFWLGLASLLFTIFTIFQYFRMHHYNADFNKEVAQMHASANEKFANYNERIRLYTENMEQRLNTLTERVSEKVDLQYNLAGEEIKKVQDELRDLDNNISQSSAENEVTTLMMCISSFPDPAMFGSIPKKKIYLRYYLEKLRQSFVEYVNHINFDAMNDTEMNKLSVVLASLKYVVVRSQNVFSAYHQNITFDKLLNAINSPLADIVERNVVQSDMRDKLLGISDTFRTMINDISIE